MKALRRGTRVVDSMTDRAGVVTAKVNWDRTYYKVRLDGIDARTVTREGRDLKREDADA